MQRPAAHGRLRGYQIAGQILSASEPLPEPVRSPAAVRIQMQQREQLGSGKSMQRPAAHGRLRGYQIAGQILSASEPLPEPVRSPAAVRIQMQQREQLGTSQGTIRVL